MRDVGKPGTGLMRELEPTARRLPGFVFLLAAMLVELMVVPMLATTAAGLRTARMVAAIVLLAALSVVGLHRASLALFIPALIAHLLASYTSASFFTVASAALRLLFLCYVVALIVWRVLYARTVTFDTIAGAACAYVLLGLVWGGIYVLVEHWRPGSFAMPSTWKVGPDQDLQVALTYFSFVTLTTVAYGVVHPADPATGGLCVAEALVGQLYLAIMIARLVGLHISQRPG
jgi:hypothetical protein